MKETFSIIPSFPDYEISNFGRVRTLSRKIRYVHAVTGQEHYRQTEHRFLKCHFNKRTGYKFYQLYRDKKMFNRPVHSLVAETYLKKEPHHDTVNHKDGNKLNNLVDNLEWCTNEYNHTHATQNGLKSNGSSVGTSKLDERCVYAIKNLLMDGFSKYKIAKWFGVSRATIILISQGKTWKHICPHRGGIADRTINPPTGTLTPKGF